MIECHVNDNGGDRSKGKENRRHRRGDRPEGHEARDGSQEGEEDPCEETTAHGPGKVAWNSSEQGEEEEGVESVACGSIGGEGSILDRRVLQLHVLLALIEQFL